MRNAQSKHVSHDFLGKRQDEAHLFGAPDCAKAHMQLEKKMRQALDGRASSDVDDVLGIERGLVRGEVDRYTWVDTGSSFVMSDVTATLLRGQLQQLDKITKARRAIWDAYHAAFTRYSFCGICDFENGSLVVLSENSIEHAFLTWKRLLAEDGADGR